MDENVEIVSLDQRPCCVSYLESVDVFLVGTYQLLNTRDDARARSQRLSRFSDDDLESYLIKINYRLGSFVVIREGTNGKFKSVLKYDCQESGGVFDFIPSEQDKDKCVILAAHSNGVFGVHELRHPAGAEVDMSTTTLVDVPGAQMLTCIDKFSDKQGSITVGSSDGSISIIRNGQVVLQKTCDTTDPIWQVRCIQLNSGRKLIFIGTEVSSWSVFEMKDTPDANQVSLDLIYRHSLREYNPGITCIVRLNCDIKVETDDPETLRILVGSYDETLKCYQVAFEAEQDRPKVELICDKQIAYGGIWRLKQISDNQNRIDRLYIAAMYAGSYRLVNQGAPNEPLSYEQSEPKPLFELESYGFKEKPLHYDIDYSSRASACCVADFNNSLCLIKYDR